MIFIMNYTYFNGFVAGYLAKNLGSACNKFVMLDQMCLATRRTLSV
jgi:hypothetical protein